MREGDYHQQVQELTWKSNFPCMTAGKREANSLSKKCNWVVKWRQEIFLACSFMERELTSINLKPNIYFILIHPVAFELQCIHNWVKNKKFQPHPILWVLTRTSVLLPPCASVFSQHTVNQIRKMTSLWCQHGKKLFQTNWIPRQVHTWLHQRWT